MTSPEGAVARHSVSVAAWTAISRATGFLRVVAIAAVLGPTYLGNTFLAANLLPNLLLALLGGSLVTALLVPALVRRLDAGGIGEARTFACGALGVALAAFGAVALAAALAAPLILELLTAAVPDAGVADDQLAVGWPLLLLLLPQVPLYGLATVSGATMNALGEFRLPAAAPALENLGVIATMGVFAIVHGGSPALDEVGAAEIALLGLGTTGAVALNAGAQWWGARRAGIALVPRPGWRDPGVRELAARARSAVGQAGLDAARVLALLVAANRVPGGVVAFGLALNFFQLPLALGATPVATAFLPRLARLAHACDLATLREELARGTSIAFFVTVPAAIGYLALSFPVAEAVAWGEMSTPRAVSMLGTALAALALGMLAEARFLMSTNASFALGDSRSPLHAMLLRTCVSMVGIVLATRTTTADALVLVLGASVTVGNVFGTWWLDHRLARRLPGDGRSALPPLRVVGGSLLVVGPAYLIAEGTAGWLGGDLRHVVAIVVAVGLATAGFLMLQRRWGAPELRFLAAGLRGAPDPGTVP